MTRFWRAIAALLLLAGATAAHADERILRYASDVQVERDGTLDVTETIDIRAENDRINHGIYRDFPTRYRGRNGSQVRVGFQLEGATLDGQFVPAATEAVSNGVRIKIGDADKTVEVGDHRYVLRYRTTRQIGRFKGYDELYWNATGNGWIFPIDVATATIHLPGGAKPGQRAAYTGAQGSTATNASVIDERAGEISWRTDAPLGPYEGLTVAVAFPKGIVAPPSQGDRAAWWLADWGPPMLGLLSLIGLAWFYFIAWQRAGRDPRAGTVVPLFSPPDNLSPAAVRYILTMNADNRAFAAALVDMGVKGHVRLVEEDGGWLSSDKTRIERLAGASPLSDDEDAALPKLVQVGGSIVMDQKNHLEFSSAKNGLQEILKAKYEGTMFKRNYGWAAAGLLLWFAALWVTAASVALATGTGALWQVAVVVGSLVASAMLWLALHDSAVGKCLLSLVAFFALAIAAAVGFPLLTAALGSGWLWPMLPPLLALPLVITAFWWISAPTPEGRRVLDQIAGFKQYLSITERERLDRMTAPEDTPAIFERYLPYAIALGVENRWANRFQGVLAAAAAQGQQGFGWYSGNQNPWDSPGAFVDDVGSSLSSSISSASTAPGSSSGSGGGGSSGGGGGGGGGGGW